MGFPSLCQNEWSGVPWWVDNMMWRCWKEGGRDSEEVIVGGVSLEAVSCHALFLFPLPSLLPVNYDVSSFPLPGPLQWCSESCESVRGGQSHLPELVLRYLLQQWNWLTVTTGLPLAVSTKALLALAICYLLFTPPEIFPWSCFLWSTTQRLTVMWLEVGCYDATVAHQYLVQASYGVSDEGWVYGMLLGPLLVSHSSSL